MDRARHDAADQAELVARSSYGKLLAILAKRCGDIAVAEDALGDAFAAALAQWPRDGTPTNPLGWLLTVARRSIGHAAGRRQTAEAAIELVQLLQDEREATVASAFGDERLALMFVCAHPAIDSDVQTPLMLQTVLGLDAARIAACFLVSSGTMSQRLVRAKRKIRDAGIAFVVPDRTDLTGRLDMVLSAVYAAYGTAWEDVNGTDGKLAGLASEAIWLARLLRKLLPDDPEVMGLLSLMLHCEARRSARRDAQGVFVPLDRQDASRWSGTMIGEAEALIRSASLLCSAGPLPDRGRNPVASCSSGDYRGALYRTAGAPLRCARALRADNGRAGGSCRRPCRKWGVVKCPAATARCAERHQISAMVGSAGARVLVGG
jgi:RNA polymerase sigma-70 factor (ECF subfamily)